MFDILPFMTFVMVGAFTPGPNNCMALSHAGSQGLRSGFMFSTGVFLGMLIIMLACGLFSGYVVRNLRHAEQVMRYIGAGYMFWLAWSLWNAAAFRTEAPRGRGRLLLLGCTLQLINAKLMVYGLTAYSVFILPVYTSRPALVLFAALLALVGFLGTIAWALCGTALEKVFRDHGRLVNRSLAVLVLGCAISMLV